MSTEHISAVICTRNRDDKIGTAVKSVLANDYPSFDLTVIDQSTTDATRKVVEPLAAADPRLHYVHVDEAGLSRAYNNGIGRTTGEILAFTDDDCIVAADWLTSIAKAFAAEPDGELLYGQVLAAGGHVDDMVADARPGDRRGRSGSASKDGFKVFGMGANFAARRTPVRLASVTSTRARRRRCRCGRRRTTTWPTGPFGAGGVILLRPDVALAPRRPSGDRGLAGPADRLRHRRRRVLHQARPLPRPVRAVAADPQPRRARPPSGWSSRSLVATSRPRSTTCAASLSGIRGSFKFKVDRATRMYVDPTSTAPVLETACTASDPTSRHPRRRADRPRARPTGSPSSATTTGTSTSASDHVGGLASSFTDPHGFIWDHGGHVMFSHYNYFDELVENDAARRLRPAHARGVGVDLRPVRPVPVPEQHPPPAARRVPRLRDGDHRGAASSDTPATTSTQWITSVFGDGIAKHFMRPYNFKVWAHPLEMMGNDVAGRPGADRRRPPDPENQLDDRDDVSWGPNNLFKFPLLGTGMLYERIADAPAQAGPASTRTRSRSTPRRRRSRSPTARRRSTTSSSRRCR